MQEAHACVHRHAHMRCVSAEVGSARQHRWWSQAVVTGGVVVQSCVGQGGAAGHAEERSVNGTIVPVGLGATRAGESVHMHAAATRVDRGTRRCRVPVRPG